MSQTPLISGFNVQQIVQEVLRRLGHAAAQTPVAVQTPVAAQLPPQRPVTNKPQGQLVWSQPVVSFQQLDGKLEDVNELVILATAVITPAARDELKHRSIRIVRGGSALKVIGAITIGIEAGIANVRHADATMLESDDQWNAFFRSAIATGEHPLAITKTPHRIACVANRISTVRAIAISDLRQLENAAEDAKANVLCISPIAVGHVPIQTVSKRWQLAISHLGVDE
jgi:hypothetical protein